MLVSCAMFIRLWNSLCSSAAAIKGHVLYQIRDGGWGNDLLLHDL